MRHDPSHDLEQAEPSPSLLAALDQVERDRAEREQADRIAQARSDAVCRAEQERRVQ
jgi:hypothetical protein